MTTFNEGWLAAITPALDEYKAAYGTPQDATSRTYLDRKVRMALDREQGNIDSPTDLSGLAASNPIFADIIKYNIGNIQPFLERNARLVSDAARVKQEQINRQARQGSGGKAAPTGIQSTVLTTPDGVQRRVKVGSKAYDKYIAMGAKESGGNIQYDEGGAPIRPQTQQDKTLQQIANKNPALADDIMDTLGYTGSPNGSSQTPISQEEFYFDPKKETIDQYNSRIAGLRTGSSGASGTDGSSQGSGITQPETGSAMSDLDSFLSSMGLSSATLTGNTGNSRLDVQNVIDGVMKATGLPQAAKQIDTMSREIEELENKRDDEIRAVNENPWLTEGVRIATVNKITEKYEDRIGNRVNRLTLMQDTYNSARKDAQFAAGLAIDQYNADRNFQMDQIQMYLDQREAAVKAYQDLLDQQSDAEEKAFDRSLKLAGLDIDQQRLELDRYKASREGSGGGGLTLLQALGYRNQVQDNFRADPNVKDFEPISQAYQVATNAYKQQSGAGDVVLMRMIAKLTDPTTGVREEEFRTFEGAQSTLSRYGVNLTKRWWAGDRLTQEGRNALYQVAQNIYGNRKTSFDSAYDYYNNQLNQVEPGAVVAPYTAPEVSQVGLMPISDTGGNAGFWGKVGGFLFGDE